MADLEDDVDGGRREGGEVLGEGRGRERQPRGARREIFAEHLHAVGQRRRHREAAVADDLERDALPDLRLGSLVERQGEVRMRVDVDEPGRDDLAAGVDLPPRRSRRSPLDGQEPAAADAHIGVDARRAGAVDHVAATNQQIVHDSSPARRAGPARSLPTASGGPTRA
jgi:hypothetical protein